ncbi:sulfatase-like hydrolase/transferase [Deferribacteraceae bacterium V6Fe1]|nr:sulfatase-like hydrolase/transferase [Deferribacteraceae bacterium V6Fe1]
MKERLYVLFKTQLVNFFLILCLHLLFYLFSIKSNALYSKIFIVLSALSNTFMFIFVLIVINLPFILLTRRFQKSVIFISNTIILIFLLVDLGIYRIYGFHFNAMVIGMITTPGFWDSVQLGMSTTITSIFLVLLIIIFEIIIVKYGPKINLKPKSILLFYLSLILLTAIEKVGYAVCDIYNIQNVTRYTKVYPLYQPLTVRGFAKKVLKIDINKEKGLEITKTNLDYPKSKITIKNKVDSPKNILVVVIDSLRFDMINDEVTPNIYKISKISQNFQNHYSGGNSTRFGIFSLFYGLYGYYWHDFLNNRQGPVIFNVLKDLGYNFKILSATLLTFPEFRKTVFIDIPESVEDTFDTNDKPLREKILVDRFKKFRDNYTSDKPYFSFIFFDAPHAREYPKEFEKFHTNGKEANYLIIGKKNITAVKNAYLNSVYYDDYLVGDIFNYLKEKGDLENTIVVITGDHGEEFYEEGHFGHNNSFGKYQTKVPFIVYFPKKEPKNINTMTSHYDFVPTVLDLVGVSNPHKDYSFGANMFDMPLREYVISCNWSNCGIIDNESVLYFSYETHKSLNMTLYDQNYNEVTDRDFINKKKQRLYSLIKEFSYFYKH